MKYLARYLTKLPYSLYFNKIYNSQFPNTRLSNFNTVPLIGLSTRSAAILIFSGVSIATILYLLIRDDKIVFSSYNANFWPEKKISAYFISFYILEFTNAISSSGAEWNVSIGVTILSIFREKSFGIELIWVRVYFGWSVESIDMQGDICSCWYLVFT